MGWIILALFLAWYFYKQGGSIQGAISSLQGTMSGTVGVIRNELSGFSSTPAAGIGSGSATDPGSHASSPGASATPLGQVSAQPSSMLLPPASLPVMTMTLPLSAGGGIPVGSLTPTNAPTGAGVVSASIPTTTPVYTPAPYVPGVGYNPGYPPTKAQALADAAQYGSSAKAQALVGG